MSGLITLRLMSIRLIMSYNWITSNEMKVTSSNLPFPLMWTYQKKIIMSYNYFQEVIQSVRTMSNEEDVTSSNPSPSFCVDM